MNTPSEQRYDGGKSTDWADYGKHPGEEPNANGKKQI
jgi:hypothetical protein